MQCVLFLPENTAYIFFFSPMQFNAQGGGTNMAEFISFSRDVPSRGKATWRPLFVYSVKSGGLRAWVGYQHGWRRLSWVLHIKVDPRSIVRLTAHFDVDSLYR